MRPLKVILLITVCALWLLPTSPAHAILLSEGESLTLFYDFSSLSPSPPYNDLTLQIPEGSMENLSVDGGIQHTIFDDLSDPSGSQHVETIWFPGLGPVPEDTIVVPDFPDSFSTSQYVQLLAFKGDWLVNVFPQLSMSFEGNNTPLASGSPVPEPATMLLLGTALVGLVGFRRKFRK